MRLNRQPRDQWHDRNGASLSFSYEGSSIAPHPVTQRWSYTVPTGQKAMVEACQVLAIRRTAPSSASVTQASIKVQPSGGSLTIILHVQFINITVDVRDHAEWGQGPVLYSGDFFAGYTGDASTGGTCNYMVATKLTQFDG